jgi:spore coat polysaccharide biosynthesis protein SpsF
MITAIVQARMGSTRLPGKVLAEICGRPLLWHVVDRLNRAEMLGEVVVATSDSPQDDPIEELCKDNGIKCFRGSEEDVLDRYYQAAKHFGSDIIARITADCPMIDPSVLDKIIEVYLRGECDYASNTVDRTYPDGLDAEVLSFGALERAWIESRLPSEREHVTPYIWKNPDRFKICHVKQEENMSRLRWTVDEAEDLAFVRTVYRHLYHPGRVFLQEEILKLLVEHPELLEINRGLGINSGYLRSLEKDQIVSAGRVGSKVER